MNNSTIQKTFLRGLISMVLAAALPAVLRAADGSEEAASQAATQFDVAAMRTPTAAATPSRVPTPSVTATSTPGATISAPGAITANLSQLDNRHLITPLAFTVNGQKLYATGGMDPAHPEKSFLVFWAPGQGAVIIDIHGYLTVTDHTTTFAMDGQPLMLEGFYGYPNPYEDSAFTLSTYTKDASGKPVAAKQLIHLTTSGLKTALYAKGQELRFGDEEYRLFYGDAVSRSADNTHFQLGPGKGVVFAQRYKDGSYNNDPVPLDVSALAGGKTVNLVLSKQTTVALSLAGDILTIVQVVGGK